MEKLIIKIKDKEKIHANLIINFLNEQCIHRKLLQYVLEK